MTDRLCLLDMTQRYADGLATAAEVARLQDLLRADADARREFRHYMLLDAGLTRLAAAGDLAGRAAPWPPDRPGRPPLARGRYRVATVAGLVCSLVLVVGLGWIPPGTSSWATVIEGGPGVHIESGGLSRPARAGDRLRRGESISVPDDATARVRVAAFGSATLGPGTRIQRLRDEEGVQLTDGFVEFTGERREPVVWRVRTPHAEATVGAADFSIAAASGRTSLRVARGQAQVTSLGGTSRRIPSGTRAVIERDSPPVVTSCRSGTALLLTSRRPIHTDWDRFNQLVTDSLLTARLWQMGFRVDVRHYEDVQVADLADRALVVASLFDDGVGEPALERIGLCEFPVPVICLEPAGYPQLGMSVDKRDVGFGFRGGASPVDFPEATHPLSAGLRGSQEHLLRRVIGWGRPAGDATLVAHLPGHPEQAVIFGYDTRQRMAAGVAPARRVGLFLDPSGSSDDSHVDWRLLEAAVNWCVELAEHEGSPTVGRP